MLKLDAHQHFWKLQDFSYPWLTPDLAVLYRDYAPPDLAPGLTEQGVAGTVAVQASHSGAETEWLLGLAGRYDFIKGVVGWVNLASYNLDERLARLQEVGPLCGVRHQVHDEADEEWLLRPAVVRGLRLVAERDLAYDLLVRPQHLPHLPALFGEVPDGRWVIDHLAKPPIKRGELEPWRRDLRRVADYPQVYCKVSGLITEADHRAWQKADLRPYLDTALELFGPARLLFGSDWPVCLLAGSYAQVHEVVTEWVAALSPAEQAAIWGETAREVYKLSF